MCVQKNNSIKRRFSVSFSKIFVQLFRYTSSKPFFRTILNHTPMWALSIGDKLATESLDDTLLNQPKTGGVALFTQSGALKTVLLSMMAKESIGLSRVILYDRNLNRNLDESDILEELSRQAETRVIMACFESIQNGRKFMDTCKKITKIKPMVILKTGKSKVGTRAVLSHTGSMSGSDLICSVAFHQSHVLRAQTIEELTDFAKALVLTPSGAFEGIAIVTNGGGCGVLAADACVDAGLEVAELPRSIKDDLKKRIPLISEIINPIDIKYAATAETFEYVLSCLLECEAVGIVFLLVYPSPALDVNSLVDKIRAKSSGRKKPIVVSATGSEKFLQILSALESFGIPVYYLPERAVNGIRALIYYGKYNRTLDSLSK